MAFRKIVAIAACLSIAYGAPQNYGAQNLVLRQGSPLLRTVQTVSHAQPTLVHSIAQPQTVLRTIAQPVEHQLVHSVAQPVVQRIIQAPVEQTVHEVEEVTVEENPQYNYGYSVSDSESGDFKDRQETRDGDVVSGSYTVADPDGRIRHVEYTADAENGFQARVTYDGEAGPVAIPFDNPTTTNTVVAAAPAANDAVAVVDARNNVQTITTHSAPSVVRTVAAPAAVHTVSHAAPAFVRTVAAPAAVHTVSHAAPTFVRTVAAPAAVHAIHDNSQLFSTVRAAPAVHAVHNNHQVLNNGLIRTVGSPIQLQQGLVRSVNGQLLLNNGFQLVHA